MITKTYVWYVYIVEFGPEFKFYTGISTDVKRRIDRHAEGRGAKCIRGKGPVVLVYKSKGMTRSEASKLEYKIKQLSRAEKKEFLSR